MPIKGLDLAPENASQGLPRIGTLHKGGPKRKRKKGDREYEIFGEDLTHFRVTFEPGYEAYAGIFEETYGKEPNNLLVMVNGDTVTDAFEAWREEYGPSGTATDKGAVILQRRCDGEEQHLWYNGKSGFYQKSRKSCESAVCGCKPMGRLNILLPEFSMLTGVLGYFTIQTSSERDIRTMYARLVSAQVLFGGLRGVELLLYREPQKLNVPDVKDGKRTGKKLTATKYMLEMRVQPTFVQQHLLPALNNHRAELPSQISGQPAASGIPSTERTRQSLGSGGQRRLGAEPQQKQLPPATAMVENQTTGEDFGADLTIKENADQWYTGWIEKGLRREEILAALDVTGIGQWKQGSIAADAAIVAFFEAMQAEVAGESEAG